MLRRISSISRSYFFGIAVLFLELARGLLDSLVIHDTNFLVLKQEGSRINYITVPAGGVATSELFL